jgi:AcrR family transcriptional regulator
MFPVHSFHAVRHPKEAPVSAQAASNSTQADTRVRQSRERKPPVEIGQIVDAAIAIADAEGFDAVSMRRVAERLGLGTMTLYCHVRDKDELIDLMHDTLIAEQHLDVVPQDWRQGLTAIARSAHASYLRHPWALQAGHRPMLGRHGLRHIDQSLAVTASLTDDANLRLAVIIAVDDLVLGCTQRELAKEEFLRQRGLERGCAWSAVVHRNATARALIEAGALPSVAEAVEAGVKLPDPEQRFERELTWLLDGIERDVAARAAAGDPA